MSKKRTINIVFCMDRNFLMQACVTIHSLFLAAKNKCYSNAYCIVSRDCTSFEFGIIKNIINSLSKMSKVVFKYENETYDNAHIPDNMYPKSNAAYYKLMIADILQDVDRVIYLDLDTIILKDLIELDNICVDGKVLAGCLDFGNNIHVWKQKMAKIKLPLQREQYINTGVMVMNLKEIRKMKLSQIWMGLAKIKQVPYKNQDVLNSTCLGKIKIIDAKYNINIIDGSKINTKLTPNMLKKAVILHYICPKPWKYKGLLSSFWWEYAKKTQFYDLLSLNYAIRLKDIQKTLI